jgi:hypothetical protein
MRKLSKLSKLAKYAKLAKLAKLENLEKLAILAKFAKLAVLTQLGLSTIEFQLVMIPFPQRLSPRGSIIGICRYPVMWPVNLVSQHVNVHCWVTLGLFFSVGHVAA